MARSSRLINSLSVLPRGAAADRTHAQPPHRSSRCAAGHRCRSFPLQRVQVLSQEHHALHAPELVHPLRPLFSKLQSLFLQELHAYTVSSYRDHLSIKIAKVRLKHFVFKDQATCLQLRAVEPSLN